MDHWRTFFDNRFIGWWDLQAGKSFTVTIAKIEREKLESKGKKDAKLIMTLEGKEKKFVCNITNAKVIAGMYGNDTRKWIGKSFAIYATTTQAFGETVECIRVKPTIPKGGARLPESSPETEPQEKEAPHGDV